MNEVRLRVMYDDLKDNYDYLKLYNGNLEVIATINKGDITSFEKDGFEIVNESLTIDMDAIITHKYIMYDFIKVVEFAHIEKNED